MVARLENLSGWILPDASYIETQEWWHVATLYDLRETGVEELNTPEAKIALDAGDEDPIKLFAYSVGFVKIGRKLVEAKSISTAQLKTLQQLISMCSPEDELGFQLVEDFTIRYFTVDRLMKAKSSAIFHNKSIEQV